MKKKQRKLGGQKDEFIVRVSSEVGELNLTEISEYQLKGRETMKQYETKCPKCKGRIFHLIQVRSEVVEYKVFLDSAFEFSDGKFIAITEIGSRDDGEVIHYECPVCKEVVCYSFTEAETILRGEVK